MQSDIVLEQGIIDWAIASRALPGESVCGDCHIVKPVADGVLVSVLDGLGHGREARDAADMAVLILEEHPDWPLETLLQRCHESLARTRGAVMTLARLNTAHGELTWVGIGNVEAALLRGDTQTHPASVRVVLRGGLVGYQLPHLQPSRLGIFPGDVLVMVTDGIAPEFHDTVLRGDPPQQIADGILKRHFKGNDDALVLVLRYVGHGQE
jgi:serine phosphatase RsbU (regulator of sigma subunit)